LGILVRQSGAEMVCQFRQQRTRRVHSDEDDVWYDVIATDDEVIRSFNNLNTTSSIVLSKLSRLNACLQASKLQTSCEHFLLSAVDVYVPPRGADRPLHMPLHSRLSRKVLAYTSAGTLAVAGGGYYFLHSGPAYPASTRESRRPPPPWRPPGREQNIDVLKASGSGDDNAKLDLLIVGGGATGAGVAVDAASRGLRVAVVERDDFSSGLVARADCSRLFQIFAKL
jgi:FAD dependent oxidoreductase